MPGYGSSVRKLTPGTEIEANIPRGFVREDPEMRRMQIEETTAALKSAKAENAERMRSESASMMSDAMTRGTPPYDEGVAMPAPSPLDMKEPGKVRSP